MRCIIPARGGSKRIPRKNLVKIGGIPLVLYSIQTAIEMSFDPVIVSTDDNEIADIAKTHLKPVQSPIGDVIVHRRGKKASTDFATDKDVMDDVVKAFGETKLTAYLRPTTPFRDIGILMDAIKFFEGKQADLLICIEPMTESAYKSYKLSDDGFVFPMPGIINPNLPNQIYPITYKNNGYLDLFRTGQRVNRTVGFVTPPTIEIDTPEDLEYAKWYYQTKLKGGTI